MPNQKGFTPILVITAVILILSLLGFGFLYFSAKKPAKNLEDNKISTPDKVATVEAKPIKVASQSAITKLKSPYSEYKNLINDGTIFLIRDSKLYTLDTNTMELSLFPIGNFQSFSNLSFSNDGKYLFTNTEGFLVIYDLAQKKFIAVSMNEQKVGPNPRVELNHTSPNNKYFLLTTSCCPGDSGIAVYSINGQILQQLSGGTAVWSPDGSKFALSKGEFQLSILPLGPTPFNSSLYFENLSANNLSEKLLIKATNQKSYQPIQWLDNTNLLYKETSYSQPFPQDLQPEQINDSSLQDKWLEVYQNPFYSYWKMNIQTAEITEAIEPETDSHLTSQSPSKKWKISMEVENSRGAYYIFKNDSNLKIKLDATEALWKPSF